MVKYITMKLYIRKYWFALLISFHSRRDNIFPPLQDAILEIVLKKKKKKKTNLTEFPPFFVV